MNTKTYFFDLDGCVYFGNKPNPEAITFINRLYDAGIRYAFISNNSSDSIETLKKKLRGMNVRGKLEIFTPLRVSGSFIEENYGTSNVYVVGGKALKSAIKKSGHNIADESGQACSVVFFGRDTGFTYKKMQTAANFILNGAAFITANPDYSHPGAGGAAVPETGALAAGIIKMTGCKPVYIGKPGEILFSAALRGMGAKPGESVFVGDNLYTDIAGGNKAGFNTIHLNYAGVYDENIKPWMNILSFEDIRDV